MSRTYTPKEQAIIDGWGMYWGELSDFEQEFALRNNGFVPNLIGERHNGGHWYFKGKTATGEMTVSVSVIGNKPCIRPLTLNFLETNNNWYRVDEKLPEHGESVMCFDEGEVYRDCVYYKSVDRFIDNQSEQINPSHWRYDPLPPDPIY